MAVGVTVSELELLCFFGVEPELADDEPWVYNDSVYLVRDEHYELSFGLRPSYKDVSINLRTDGLEVYQLIARDVAEIPLHNDQGREALEISVSAGDSIWLRLKPSITIRHVVGSP